MCLRGHNSKDTIIQVKLKRIWILKVVWHNTKPLLLVIGGGCRQYAFIVEILMFWPMHNSCTFLSNFQQLLFCRNRYNEKQRMCMSSVRKYNDEILSVLHDRPRRFVKQAIKKLANPSSSLSSYNTNLKDITCDCLDYTYHGPWCKHLLEQAIASGSMTDTAYNTLDFQGHNLIPYTLQEKSFYWNVNFAISLEHKFAKFLFYLWWDV